MLDRVESHVVGNTVVRATVGGDVADVGRRLRQGDPTVGWQGDSTMSLHLAVECDVLGRVKPDGRHLYEVYATDAQGNDYLALQWPRCDVSLLRKLAELSRSNAVDRAVARQAAKDAARAEAEREQRLEIADRLHFGLMRDLGHLYGQRHRQHAI